jgi:hypothetical protein
MPTYGLKVYNGDNQVILDSDEGFATFIKTGGGTLGTNTGTLIDWPSSIYISDLFFVRLPGSGFVANNFIAEYVNETRQIYTTYTASQQWLEAARTTSNVSGFADGYGLNVFDGSGVAESNLLFTTNTPTALDIVEVGTYDELLIANNTSKNITINSTEPHYVLMNGTFRLHLDIYAVGQFELKNGYQFNYSGTTLNSIDIESKLIMPGYTPVIGGDATYMIIKLRS